MIIRGAYRTASASMDMPGGLFAYSPEEDRWTELPSSRQDEQFLTNIAFTGDQPPAGDPEPGNRCRHPLRLRHPDLGRHRHLATRPGTTGNLSVDR